MNKTFISGINSVVASTWFPFIGFLFQGLLLCAFNVGIFYLKVHVGHKSALRFQILPVFLYGVGM